ncbi:MAG TPA: TIM barrel protein, partial [Bacillota bacterium]|nr:TIM barrel protein [Bacillota bacterium]
DVAGVIMKYSGMFDHFHANDSNMKGPGFGDVDFVPIMQALEDSGYKGFVSLEAFDFDPDPLTIVRKSLAYMKACEKRQ